MKILTNYEGSSIHIVDEKDEDNIIVVSPKMEGKRFSDYYNFIVDNDSKNVGTIIIKRVNEIDTDIKPEYKIPFIKDKNKNYVRLSSKRFRMENDNIIIDIKPGESLELSSAPRYTMEDLNTFLSNIKSDIIQIKNDVLPEIILGDNTKETIIITGRQHPGETLSSYFIEGIINSIIDNNLTDKYSFVIYPLVNQKGVKEGNHRITDGNDYNRLWHTNGLISEIDYIKSQIDSYKITTFIDVHCDEITPKDYIRANDEDEIKEVFDNIQVLGDQSRLKRFIRALVKQGKVINLFDKTAREYIKNKYDCEIILIELSLTNGDRQNRYDLGYDFITKLLGKELKNNRVKKLTNSIKE